MKLSHSAYLASGLLALAIGSAQAQQTWTLNKVVSLTRHGVRPQTDTAKLNKATGLDWSKFAVPDGQLTGHGYAGMRLQGNYQLQQWQSQGLTIGQTKQCANPNDYFLWSSPSQRIKATAKAVADGMFPGCGVMPASVSAKYGPLFELYHLHQAHPDKAVMKQQIMAKMGSPEQVAKRYQASVELLKKTVCAPNSCKFLDKPWGVHFKSTGKPELEGPGKYGATIGETVRLQYSDNLPIKDVAFGHGVNAKAVKSLMAIHAAEYNLALDTPEFAAHSGSLLMRQILSALTAGTTLHAQYPGDQRLARPLVMFFGHDTNIAEIQTMLGFNWQLAGYPRNDVPPGATLSFAHFSNQQGQQFVRVRFATRSLDQWRSLSPLTHRHPLLHADLSFKGCQTTPVGTLCPIAQLVHRASRLLVKDGQQLAVFKTN
ncbi:histidine-type phosphatase [Celerinatantimonas yamalensis]|uniref:Histidine-type phosphatase n=1 Tax=Celerinatantimonas yamalensis TaxID=559956 RepID=A0ABW9G7K0_9GAMM